MVPISLIIFFGMIMIAFTLVLYFYRCSAESKFRERLASSLNDPEIRWKKKGSTFQYRDLNFSCSTYGGSGAKSLASLLVSVECRGTGGDFVITGEDGVGHFLRNVGATRGVQTGNEEFDRRFCIVSETPQFIQSYFMSSEKRDSVRRLFDSKAAMIKYKRQRLTVIWMGSSSHEDGVAAIKSAIEALSVLAKEMPPSPVVAFLDGASEGDALNRARTIERASRSFAASLISAIWSSWTSKGSFSQSDRIAALQKDAEAIAGLAKDMPTSPEVSLGGTDSGIAFNRVLIIGLATASLVSGVISMIWSLHSYPVFDAWKLFLFSLRFSLPALAIFLYFAVTTLTGNSRAHWDILKAGALALAGFLLLGCALTGVYNGMNDISAPAEHTVLIIDKQVHRSRQVRKPIKSSSAYKLVVQSWRPGRAQEAIKTDRRTYQKAAPGTQKAVIYTKPGKLGFEWLVGYHLSQ
jgi:hypothetical protein